MSNTSTPVELTPFSELLAEFRDRYDDADELLEQAGQELAAAEHTYIQSVTGSETAATRKCGHKTPTGPCGNTVLYGTAECSAGHPVRW